jgi:hypothetical protein
MTKRFLITVITGLTLLSACAHAPPGFPYAQGCDLNPKLQTESSARLLKLVQEDQADRSGPYDSVDWARVNPRDLARRIEVAKIFAEGCFNSASDFASAAMVYQHGSSASHYYQAFIWANDAVKLGDESQRWLSAAALDRYLVKTGHKQLFGTQFSKDPQGRWCIQPVEASFPESIRIHYIKRKLKEDTSFVLEKIGSTQTAENTKDCRPELLASPRKSVPGFW